MRVEPWVLCAVSDEKGRVLGLSFIVLDGNVGSSSTSTVLIEKGFPLEDIPISHKNSNTNQSWQLQFVSFLLVDCREKAVVFRELSSLKSRFCVKLIVLKQTKN